MRALICLLWEELKLMILDNTFVFKTSRNTALKTIWSVDPAIQHQAEHTILCQSLKQQQILSLQILLACRVGEYELIRFQVRGFRAESCAVHLGDVCRSIRGKEFSITLRLQSGCIVALWALLQLGTAEPFCFSMGVCWFPPRTLYLALSEKGAGKPLKLRSKRFNPLMISDSCLASCYQIYCQKHLWPQEA